jgi:hypothetical protein
VNHDFQVEVSIKDKCLQNARSERSSWGGEKKGEGVRRAPEWLGCWQGIARTKSFYICKAPLLCDCAEVFVTRDKAIGG